MGVEKDEKEEEPLEEDETEEKVEEPEETEEGAKETEEKKPAPEKKAEAEEVVEERIYTVPFGRAWIAPRKRRSPKAMRILRSFVEKHMKIDDDSINITNEVNEKIWSRGIEKPPRKIRIRAAKDKEGIVTVHLAEED